ncbi:hypothetical protein WN71_009610 [Streptomyces mangrovisoli]|uniref:Uncharacterized protein n=1 Tax=Streptomyces mangrovisoli TaxID=1428628 RepID=A0A1J4P1Q0_9ACTN|nr:hypothetical protein WN71_009610 [Streptomyces mangrovisoli]
MPPAARDGIAGTDWAGLPHRCTGRHNVPDTPDILIGVLDADPGRRVRAVGDLYRLLLDGERVFPATAPAALVVAALLDDPRTLVEDRWDRRAGRRPLRAELLNWLASFADTARLEEADGAGTARDLAAARAVRPSLHGLVARYCEADDVRVREAALAATALLTEDPTLVSCARRHAPAVRDVLATSADSYHRWIARSRLAAWGEDITGLVTAEEERRAALDRAHASADDPWAEDSEQAARFLAEQPEDTAALEPPGRRLSRRTTPAPTAAARPRSPHGPPAPSPSPHRPPPEPPVAVPGSAPGHRGAWRIARSEERAEWTFTPYIGVGPLHFGMALEEITGVLGAGPTVSSYTHEDGERRLVHADFPTTGIRCLFRGDRLGCVAVDALTGPQVRLGAVPLTGCAPSRVEAWLVHRTTTPDSLRYSPAGDPVLADLGLAIRTQRAGDLVLTRPLFLLHDWLDLWHSLPAREWHHF